jgi:alpha-glucuronidase
MTGYGPWREPHPNAWLFARLAWDPTRDADALLREFCEVVFGADAAMRAQRYLVLEREVARSLARGHA